MSGGKPEQEQKQSPLRKICFLMNDTLLVSWHKSTAQQCEQKFPEYTNSGKNISR